MYRGLEGQGGMTRQYRLGKRAEMSAQTRKRIVDGARDLIVKGNINDVSLDAVARHSGTTRTTIYDQFGSRADLLLAVLNAALEPANASELQKAYQHPNAAEAMRRAIRATCRFWADGHAVLAQVKSYARIDAEMAAIDASKEELRLTQVKFVANRLHAEGCLQAGCTKRKAVETLNLLMSFESFDQLHSRTGLGAEAAATLLVDLASKTLLA
jgi:AcrR family transcriptional regulator